MTTPIRDILESSSIFELSRTDKFDAVVPPSVNDDETLGYLIKSFWFDQLAGKSYQCIDPTAGAAVWITVASSAFLDNYSAIVAPTVNDDDLAGYGPGSKWYNTVGGEVYLCVDNTTGAAVWVLTTLTLDDLGSAATYDVGAAAGQLPTNADIPTFSGTSGVAEANEGFVPDDGTASSGRFLKDDGTWGSPAAAPVDSVNTQTGAVVLDADDISDAATTNKFVTAGDITTLGNTSGTNSGDEVAFAGTTGVASTNDGNVPDDGVAASGRFLRDDGTWVASTAPVDSVNTQTGAVVLDADDISDAATTNKFVTAGDITTLGNTSGTNTGDQVIPVASVNTQTGAVVLDADDISDAATTNKFVTAGDITTLGNTSGTNTGDQVIPVASVNTQTGAVVLDADDIDDAATTNKFVTAGDITTLGNTSGTNSGDEVAFAGTTGVASTNDGNVPDDGVAASGRYLEDDGTWSTPVGLGGVFGTEQGYTESTALSTNATATPTTKVTHTIPSGAPTGLYRCELDTEYDQDNNNGQIGIDFTFNTVSQKNEFASEVPNAGDWQHLHRTFRISHVNGVASVLDMDFRTPDATGTASVRESSITVWRIS